MQQENDVCDQEVGPDQEPNLPGPGAQSFQLPDLEKQFLVIYKHSTSWYFTVAAMVTNTNSAFIVLKTSD
jgi:hypothetical protein